MVWLISEQRVKELFPREVGDFTGPLHDLYDELLSNYNENLELDGWVKKLAPIYKTLSSEAKLAPLLMICSINFENSERRKAWLYLLCEKGLVPSEEGLGDWENKFHPSVYNFCYQDERARQLISKALNPTSELNNDLPREEETAPLAYTDSLPVFMRKALRETFDGQTLAELIEGYQQTGNLPGKERGIPLVLRNFPEIKVEANQNFVRHQAQDLEIKFVDGQDDLGIRVQDFLERMYYACEALKFYLKKQDNTAPDIYQRIDELFSQLKQQLEFHEFSRHPVTAIYRDDGEQVVQAAQEAFDTTFSKMNELGKSFVADLCKLGKVTGNELANLEGEYATARGFPNVIVVYRKVPTIGPAKIEIQTLRTLLEYTAPSTDRTGVTSGFRESGLGRWDSNNREVKFIWEGDRGASKRPTSAPKEKEMDLAVKDWRATLESQRARAKADQLITVYSGLLSSSLVEKLPGFNARPRNENDMLNITLESGAQACRELGSQHYQLIGYSAGVNVLRMEIHAGGERDRIENALTELVKQIQRVLPTFGKKLNLKKPWKNVQTALKADTPEEKALLHFKSILWLVETNRYLKPKYLYMLQAHMGNLIVQLNRMLEKTHSSVRFAHIKGCKSGKDRTSREDDIEKALAIFVDKYGVAPEFYAAENDQQAEDRRQRFIALQRKLYAHSTSREFVNQNCPGVKEFIVSAKYAGGLVRDEHEAAFLALGRNRAATWTAYVKGKGKKYKRKALSVEEDEGLLLEDEDNFLHALTEEEELARQQRNNNNYHDQDDDEVFAELETDDSLLDEDEYEDEEDDDLSESSDDDLSENSFLGHEDHSPRLFHEAPVSRQEASLAQFKEVFPEPVFSVRPQMTRKKEFILTATAGAFRTTRTEQENTGRVLYRSNQPNFDKIAECIYRLKDYIYDGKNYIVKVRRCSDVSALEFALKKVAQQLKNNGEYAPELAVIMRDPENNLQKIPRA